MRRSAKRSSYHHGDLRAALIDTAARLISEKGVRDFSLAEASRVLGVAPSAPYRHFANRDELLVAVGVRACEVMVATIEAQTADASTPQARLAAAAGGYVRFAATHRPLFDTVFGAGLDRFAHPALDEAARPLKESFLHAALALTDADPDAAELLAAAIATTAHGHAAMLHLGAFGPAELAVDSAVDRVRAATLALIAGRAELTAGTRAPTSGHARSPARE